MILANRDRSLVALLLVLIYFHDLGLQLCARSDGIKRLAPVFALAGTLTLLWAAMQVSVSPIPHEWFWQFGALVGFAMTVSRIFQNYWWLTDGELRVYFFLRVYWTHMDCSCTGRSPLKMNSIAIRVEYWGSVAYLGHS